MQLQDLCRKPVGGAGQILDLAEVALQPVNLLGGKGACQELVQQTFAMDGAPRVEALQSVRGTTSPDSARRRGGE